MKILECVPNFSEGGALNLQSAARCGKWAGRHDCQFPAEIGFRRVNL